MSQKPYFATRLVQDGVDSNLINAVHNCGRIQYHNTEKITETIYLLHIDVQDGMNCNQIYSVHLEIMGESTQIVHDAVVCIALHKPLDSFVTQSISSKLPRRSVSGDQLLTE